MLRYQKKGVGFPSGVPATITHRLTLFHAMVWQNENKIKKNKSQDGVVILVF